MPTPAGPVRAEPPDDAVRPVPPWADAPGGHRRCRIRRAVGGQDPGRASRSTVTIVDQRNFHTFQPLLYEVATAGLEPGDVAYPIRAIFGQADNVTFRFAKVTGVDWDAPVRSSSRMPNRSPSTRSSWPAEPRPGSSASPAPRSSPSPSTPSPTPASLRDHVLRRLEAGRRRSRRRAPGGPLTFVVVGGGPTGVEVAGALAELLDVAVRHDGFRFDRATARIIAGRRARPAADPVRSRRRGLRRRHPRAAGASSCGWATWSGRSPTPAWSSTTATGSRPGPWSGPAGSPSRAPSPRGIEAPPAPNGGWWSTPTSPLGGRPRRLRRRRRRRRALGPGSDAGRICPQLAQVAIQSGAHAAQQILNRVEGRPTTPFRYHDKGIMATIGRRAAITQFPSGRGHPGNPRVAGLAGPAPRLPDRVPQQDHRAGQLVVAYLSWGSGPRVIVGDDARARGGEPEPTPRPPVRHRRRAGLTAGGAAGVR